MSKSWKPRRLEELVEFHDHRRVPLSKRERAKRTGPYPYYGAQGVIDSLDDYIFDGRYLLIAEDGENLNSRKLPVAQIAEGQFWVNNHAHVVKALADVADDDFLRLAIEYHPLNGLVTGAAQPKLSQANLKRLELDAPDYELQNQIGGVARAVDGLIENNRQRVEILEEMARLIYREWFVHFRFPGHEDVEFVDSGLGTIPYGWTVGVVGDVIRLQRGFDLPVSHRNTAGEVPVLAASGIHGRHDEWKVSGPGITTGRSGTIGRVAYIDEDFWPLNTVLWVKEYWRSSPVHAYFFLDEVGLESLASGAAVPTLNRNHVHARQTALPPTALVADFDSVAVPLFDLIATLSEQNTALRSARDLLLPRLVSGELDVSGLDLEPVA